ncbi:hypothetical protein COO60DRAFT_39998 [Scenedesmus sp. NREL 46B-D3]|nr:hypothetical protein COO60DRAFT_39998 [Scenedesmus sp. NREL 46B-D3]
MEVSRRSYPALLPGGVIWMFCALVLLSTAGAAKDRGPRALLHDVSDATSSSSSSSSSSNSSSSSLMQLQQLQRQMVVLMQQQQRQERLLQQGQQQRPQRQQKIGTIEMAANTHNCSTGCGSTIQLVCVAGNITLQNPCLAQCQGLSVVQQGSCAVEGEGTHTMPFATSHEEEEAVFSIASVTDRDSTKHDKQHGREGKQNFTSAQMRRFEGEGFVLVGQAAISRDFTPKTPKGLKPIKDAAPGDPSFMQPMRISADALLYVDPRPKEAAVFVAASSSSESFVASSAEPPTLPNTAADRSPSAGLQGLPYSSSSSTASSGVQPSYQMYPLNQTAVPEPLEWSRLQRLKMRRGTEITAAAAFPYNAIGKLTLLNDAGKPSAHCTATWVGDYAAITAAHCIYDRDTKTFVDPNNLLFEPGVYTSSAGARIAPHGAHKIAGIQYVSGCVTAPAEMYKFYDVAVLITETPRTTGKLGFGWSPQGYEGAINHAGYPGETPPVDATGLRKTVLRYGGCNIRGDGDGSDRTLMVQSASSTPCGVMERGESGSALFEMRGSNADYLAGQLRPQQAQRVPGKTHQQAQARRKTAPAADKTAGGITASAVNAGKAGTKTAGPVSLPVPGPAPSARTQAAAPRTPAPGGNSTAVSAPAAAQQKGPSAAPKARAGPAAATPAALAAAAPAKLISGAAAALQQPKSAAPLDRALQAAKGPVASMTSKPPAEQQQPQQQQRAQPQPLLETVQQPEAVFSIAAFPEVASQQPADPSVRPAPQDAGQSLFAPVLEFQWANETAVQAAEQQRTASNGTATDELLLTPVDVAMQPLQPATNYVWALAATAELLDEAEQPPAAAAAATGQATADDSADAAAAPASGRSLLASPPNPKPASAAPARKRHTGAAGRHGTSARQPGGPAKQQPLPKARQQPATAGRRTAHGVNSGAGRRTAHGVNSGAGRAPAGRVPPPLYLVRGVLSYGASIGPMGEEMDVAVELDRDLYEFVARAAASRPSDDGVVCGNC